MKQKTLWRLAALLLIICCVSAAGCGADRTGTEAQRAMLAAVVGDRFCLTRADGTPEETFLNGVNLGAASAGNYPGEFGIDKETYLRWFGYISPGFRLAEQKSGTKT